MTANILIVEDEMLVALELQSILEDLGHNPIAIAPDMASALNATSDRIDLALVDLNLRDGLTGPQIGERLSRDHRATVLFVTANPRVLGDGIAGTLGVLTKPADEASVKLAVDYALRVRGGARPAVPSALRLFG